MNSIEHFNLYLHWFKQHFSKGIQTRFHPTSLIYLTVQKPLRFRRNDMKQRLSATTATSSAAALGPRPSAGGSRGRGVGASSGWWGLARRNLRLSFPLLLLSLLLLLLLLVVLLGSLGVHHLIKKLSIFVIDPIMFVKLKIYKNIK